MNKLNCSLCKNTRHRVINGKLSRCTCYARIWAEAKLIEGGVNEKLLKNFWTSDHILETPGDFTDKEKLSFQVLDKVVSRVVAGERSTKQLWIMSSNGPFHYHATAYLAAKVSMERRTFKLMDIEDMSSEYFTNKDASILADLTFIKFGAELSKNLTQQLIKRIQDRAVFQNKYIVFIADCPRVNLSKDYPNLTSIIDSGLFLPY